MVAPSHLAVKIGALAGLAGILAAIFYQGAQARRADDESRRHRPIDVHDAGYVSSAECRSCHASQYESWSSSYHRTMTQVATPESVFGTFEGQTVGGYRLLRERDGFFIEAATPGVAQPERRPISLVTGSHHMQVYWFESGDGRTLGQVPYAF